MNTPWEHSHLSEFDLRSVLSISAQLGAVIYIKDEAMRFSYASPAAAQLFGVADASDLIGTEGSELNSEFASHFAQLEKEALQSGDPWLGDVEYDLPDGTRAFYMGQLVTAPAAGASGGSVVCVLCDITESKSLSTLLHEALVSADLGWFTWEPGRGFNVEERADTMFNTPGLSAWDSSRLTEGVIAEDHLTVQQLESALAAAQPTSGIIRMEHAPGELRSIEIKSSGTRSTAGAVIGTYQDVTAREQALAAEEQVTRLDTAERLAGETAAQFNNLLAVISLEAGLVGGFSRKVAGTADTRELQTHVGLLQEAVDSAAELTSRLLRLTNRDDAALTPVVVSDSVRNVADRVVPDSRLGDGKPTVDCAGPDLSVLLSPGRLDFLLEAVISNACDAFVGEAVDSPVIQVRVSGHLPDDPLAPEHLPSSVTGELVRIDVADNGRGMTDAELAQVFDVFYTTKPHPLGGGLGMAEARHICRSAGGDLSISSSAGTGTVVSMWLPKADAAEPHAGCRILVVDDHKALAEGLAAALSGEGYDATPETDSQNALLTLTTNLNSYDLVVSDLSMPNLTGTELMASVQDRGVDIPFIFMSGFVDLSAFGTELKRLGAPVLAKPLQVEDLLQHIETAVN